MAKRKVNKSEKVRDYLAEHPGAGPSETARALEEFGVTAALVSNIKARGGPVRRKKRKKGGRRRAAGQNGPAPQKTVQADAIVAAAKLIRLCGGVQEARAAVTTADQIASALQ